MNAAMTTTLSRLGLGTVQWGLNYGVANTVGQPDQGSIERMLKTAYDLGVNWLDTARAYCESEEVIGRALARTGLKGRFTVVTKTCHIDRARADSAAAARAMVAESVTASLAALGVEHVPIFLLHNGEDIYIPGVWEEMTRQKELGRIGALGASVAKNPIENIDAALGLDGLDAVQVALNVFDQRLVRSGSLSKLAERGVTVFARSVYLQGLLIMPETSVPPHLAQTLPYKRIVGDWAQAWALDPKQLAIQFVLGLPGVTSVVLGCETEAQVRENIALVGAAPLTEAQMAAARQMPDVPREIVEPWHWAGAMKATYREPPK